MNQQSVNEQYRVIVKLIEQNRLNETYQQLKALLSNEKMQEKFGTAIEQDITTYGYLQQFMRQGVNDPQRVALFKQLRCKAWEMADALRAALLDEVSASAYHQLRKSRRNDAFQWESCIKALVNFQDEIGVFQLMGDKGNRADMEQAMQRHEQQLQKFFNYVWTTDTWHAQDREGAQALLQNVGVPEADVCLLVSAVTLGLMQRWDEIKMNWLIDAAMHTNPVVAVRAWVGVVLVIQTHPQRLACYPNLQARFHLLCDHPQVSELISIVYLQLLQSRETDKVNRTMNEEIMPEVIKNVKQQIQRFKVDEGSLEENDLNPDWEKPELTDKIQQIAQLMQEGADVYLGTFQHAKNGPFFQTLWHWFYPYTPFHSAVMRYEGLNRSLSPLQLLIQNTGLCDSDKYSFCSMLQTVPAQMQNEMLSGMGFDQWDEINGDPEMLKEMTERSRRPQVICQQYLQNLFRFYRYYVWHDEFVNPFKGNLQLHRIAGLDRALKRSGNLRIIANFLLKYEHYDEALELYRLYMEYHDREVGIVDADFFQKMGFCYQKLKQYAEAIDAYRKADALNPNHLWTIRHLAACYRQLKDYATAVELYNKALEVEPENQNLLMLTANCLAQMGEHLEALKLFFKLDYLHPGNLKTMRAIGWCLFVSNQIEKAENYCRKVLAMTPQATDYLNAGHIAWVAGHMNVAAEFYTKANEACGSHNEFLQLFAADRDELTVRGISQDDITLMMDLVMGE